MNREANKILKVAFVHPAYRPDGGAERLLSDTIKILLRKKIKIVLVTRKWGGGTEEFKVVPCNFFYIGRTWKLWGFYVAAQKKLAGLNVDIIQSQVHLPNCTIYSAGGGVHKEWLSQKNRASNSFRKKVTQLSLYHNLKKYLEKNTYRSPNLQAIICNSEMVKEEITRHFDVPPEKLYTIYPGIDFETFNTKNREFHRRNVRNTLGIPDDHTVYIFIGTGFERKGVHNLLSCFSQLPEDCALIVIGNDKHLNRYKKRSFKLKINERVHFLGLQKDVKPFYAAADVFVLPSLYDAFGLVIIEAMACGLPVIASNKCGAAYDLIKNGHNGYTCDPFDQNSIVKFMMILRDPKLRNQIALNGMKTAEKLSLENMSKKLQELYRRLLDY